MPDPIRGASAVDLYSGAGGLSCGLELAGISVVAAVEPDKWACATHAYNMPTTPVYQQAVGALPAKFFRRYEGVDIVVGGPPCQGFSISASNRRSKSDPRNEEVFQFIEAAIKLRPHGRARWADIEAKLGHGITCPKLQFGWRGEWLALSLS